MSIRKWSRFVLWVLGCLASCTPVQIKEILFAWPEEFPQPFYLSAAQNPEQKVFQVYPEASRVVIKVYRGGTLAKLGHDHVVASNDVQGYILLDKKTGDYQADLLVPVQSLVVDQAELREAEGFMTQPSSSDIENTKTNMLQHVLDVAHFPFVRVRVDHGNVEMTKAPLLVKLTVHGVEKEILIPLQIEHLDDHSLVVNGSFSLKQTDYQMTPYSVMGGLLQVKDQVDLVFTIEGHLL